MDFDQKQVVELPIDSILPNRFQPRIKYNDEQIYELAESIKVHGVFQPILVRKLGDKYEIIAGERRYKASVLAGKTSIPSIVKNINDKDSMEIALVENVQRADLTPIEEAISYKRVLDRGEMTQEELAKKLGKNQSTVANKIRLLNLEEEVQDALLEGKISERHARSLLKLKDRNDQVKMLDRVIKERLTVRKTDDEINKVLGESNNNEVEKEDSENKVNEVFSNFSIPDMPIIIDDVIEGEKMDNNYNNSNNNDIYYAQNSMINSSVINSNNNVYNNPTPVKDLYSSIDSMMNNAQQINVERPVNDINTLLTPDEYTKEVKVEEIPKFVQGKFFSVPNDQYKEEKPVEEVYSNPFQTQSFDPVSNPVKESEPLPSIDKILADYSIDDEPSIFKLNIEEPKKEEVNTMPVQENVNIPNEFGFVPFDFNMNTVPTQQEVVEVPSFEIPVTPVVDVAPIEEEKVVEEVKPVITKSVVEKIEDFVKELQNDGAKIDMNIYNLDTMDQVVIRVQKETF